MNDRQIPRQRTRDLRPDEVEVLRRELRREVHAADPVADYRTPRGFPPLEDNVSRPSEREERASLLATAFVAWLGILLLVGMGGRTVDLVTVIVGVPVVAFLVAVALSDPA